MRLPLLVLVVMLAACANPVREAEGALARGEDLRALRAAREGLQGDDVAPERRKRLGAVMQKAAQGLLAGKDPASESEARELWAAMPRDTVERERAAQRLFRVIAREADDAGLQRALAELEGEMGDEAAVRSNLRTIVEETRGTAASVAAARVVTTRWPDAADRWVDLARSQAAVGAWSEARASVVEAEKRLGESCRTLPERMAAYDKVRRESAYGQLEVQRCRGFHALAAAVAAYAQQQKEVPSGGVDVTADEARTVPCPTGGPRNATWGADARAVMVSPAGTAWWVDGQAVGDVVAAVAKGAHEVVFRAGSGCRALRIDVGDGAVAVLTGELARLPAR